MVVHFVEQIGFRAAGEVQEEHILTRHAPCIRTPQNSGNSSALHVSYANCVHVCDRWCALDDDGFAPAIASLTDPERDPCIVYIDQVCYPVPIHVTHQNASGVVSVRKAGIVPHGNTSAPVTMSQIGPVFNVAIIDENDVLKPIACHVSEFYTWI